MTVPIVQYAFTAGELSPTLYGRTDLEKYDLGLSRAYNVFVDYRGGVSTRAGLEYAGEVTFPLETTRVFRFNFGIDIANTYVMVFGKFTCRFMQDGGYVLETGMPVTGISQANPGVVTAVAHGFTTGDLVFLSAIAGMTELNSRLFVVTVLTTDTFELYQPYDETSGVDTTGYTAYASGGTASRIYTVTTPYDSTDLEGLVAEQRRDTVMLTHADFPAYKMVRNDVTDWTIAEDARGSSVPTPTGLAGTASATGTATVGYVITAVRRGEESVPTRMKVLTSIVNFTTTEGQVTLTWNPVSDVELYRVYRTTVAPAATGVMGAELAGFIGIAYAASFTDGNIVPDFTDTPPIFYDPFADGAVDYVNVTAGGSGYAQDTATVTITGDGTGYEGYPIVGTAGSIIGVYTLNRGAGFTSATVAFGGGTGATGTATLTSVGGNNPRASKIFQQRQIFGGTDNQPLGVFGSTPGAYNNFDSSQIPNDGDSYEFELDGERVSPIRYFVALKRGLLAFTGSGVWDLNGGNDISVTPLNVNADAQTYLGSAPVRPIAIDNEILYVQKENGVVRGLSYNRLQDLYTGQDRSILSNHFFRKQRLIVDWAFAQTPYYIVWTVLNDGRFLSLTFLGEQAVDAWTQHETQGQVKDVTVVEEFGLDIPYFVVTRTVNGVTRKFIERMTRREGDNAEDYTCVDAAVVQGGNRQTGTASVSAATGNVTVTVTGATPFSPGDVGSDIRINNGRISITGYTSATEVTGTVRIPLTDRLPNSAGEEGKGVPVPTSRWTLDPVFSSVQGLWHLEGETVSALCNGTPIPAQVVSGGQITVPSTTSLAHVGLAYEAQITTLPAIMRDRVIEGRTRSPVSLDLRVNLARGLYVGTDPDNLYFVVERSTEPYDTPTQLQRGVKTVPVSSTYDKDGRITIRVVGPLPATILGYTLHLDVGDDED